jgi:hypothetical protein
MNADDFRKLALEISGAIESSHMNHPDFRIEGKVFASLGYPDDHHGMVRLTPEQQAAMISETSAVFASCAGAWGRQGSTKVTLDPASPVLVRTALETAARNIAEKQTRRRAKR